MGHRAVEVALESLAQHLVGARDVLLPGSAEAEYQIIGQDSSDADPPVDGSRIQLERLLESLQRLLANRRGGAPIVQGPTAQQEVLRIDIYHPRLLGPAVDRFRQFEVQRPREAAGNFFLPFHKIGPIAFYPIGPKLRATFRIDQLNIDLNMVVGALHAPIENVPHPER